MELIQNKPIRILQVFSRLGRGGAETMIMTYYRNLDRSKVQFDFLVHTDEECPFDSEVIKLGGKIYRMPQYKGSNHIQYQKKWKVFLQEHTEYKIIHGHYFTISAVYFEVARKLNRICIGHSHISNIMQDSLIGKLKYHLFIKPIKRLSDYYLACSEDAGEWMYGRDIFNHPHFHIMNNSIDAIKFTFNQTIRNQIRHEFNLENKFVIGHIGRFNYQKNHDFLIDIFSEIKNRKSDAILMLVGEGELKHDIINKINNLKLSNDVVFTGERSDVPNLLQAMDVFLFPSHYEGLGIVLIEAQAAGLPSLTSLNVVPKEAQVTELLQFISLKEDANHWSEEVIKAKNKTRLNRYQEIEEKGYDIHTNAMWLQEFYLGI